MPDFACTPLLPRCDCPPVMHPRRAAQWPFSTVLERLRSCWSPPRPPGPTQSPRVFPGRGAATAGAAAVAAAAGAASDSADLPPGADRGWRSSPSHPGRRSAGGAAPGSRPGGRRGDCGAGFAWQGASSSGGCAIQAWPHLYVGNRCRVTADHDPGRLLVPPGLAPAPGRRIGPPGWPTRWRASWRVWANVGFLHVLTPALDVGIGQGVLDQLPARAGAEQEDLPVADGTKQR
jgi:hypothetical protein